VTQVVWHITMSLDGFITGPDDSMEWAFGYPGPNRLADEVMESTGAILAGRRWYDVASERYSGRQGIYGGVLLGDGVRLYGDAGSRAPVELERVELAEAGELTSMRFRVRR
jgi:hypothetical protein